MNVYLDQINRVLPRLLALYDTNPVSPTCGLGDRFYWGWKLIDFGNGTFQGAVNGLARLTSANLLPDYLSRQSAIARIDAMVAGAARLRRPNGSLEEAFPYESSFCITALVAYDILTAVELLGDSMDRKAALDAVKPMIGFLMEADETHGFISNHLATAAAALFKWESIQTGGVSERGKMFLDRILAGQSSEGWFREYQGADPGYQSLCTTYLADIHLAHPELGLAGPLEKSLDFLAHFAHPDGSFGGLYGSRNTRFIVPAGIEALAPQFPAAAALAAFAQRSIGEHRSVTLDVVDEPNLVPFFNAYSWAATLAQNAGSNKAAALPHADDKPWRKNFSEAGLVIENRPQSYTVVSWHKGGALHHVPKNNAPAKVDGGVVGKNSGGSLFTSQAYRIENEYAENMDAVAVRAPLSPVPTARPNPWNFIVLRLLNVTLMRNSALSDLIKKLLVKMLMTGHSASGPVNVRRIVFAPEFRIEDVWNGNAQGFTRVVINTPFSAQHMASQGYWQAGDR